MSVPTGAGNYPADVSDNDPHFDLPSVGDDNWIVVAKPCPRGDCVDGWNYDEDWWCGVCKGRGGLEVEVHEQCGKEESGNDPCRCFESAEEEIAA